jgi:hypothetical protein
MHARQIRFGSQWFLVGVIFFYAFGAAMIARYMERIDAPTSANGSECAATPDVRSLQEPAVEEYRQDSPTSLIQSDGDGSNLKLWADAFGAERSSHGGDTTKTPPGQSIETTSDTVGTKTPAKQVPTKVWTKIRFVEAILKKAVIEPYYINGQIEGLQITGLDRILVARDLLLKSGDIIRAVNGHPINSKRQAYEIFKKARKKPIMIVDLLQDGEAKTLLYDFR